MNTRSIGFRARTHGSFSIWQTKSLPLPDFDGGTVMLPKGENKEEFLTVVHELCGVIRGMPLDEVLATHLNKHYGVGTESFEKLSSLMQLGVEEGWAPYGEITGAQSRPARISDPAFATAA